MTEFDIPQQKAKVIINAETAHYSKVENIYCDPRLRRDHRVLGLGALKSQHYREAVLNLSEALRDNPDSFDLHYYVALALLGGLRPNRHDRRTITSVRDHLRDASELPEAKILLALVNEDYGLFWRTYSEIPAVLRNLIDEADLERSGEILRHVPAREARTWQLLANKIENGGERVER